MWAVWMVRRQGGYPAVTGDTQLVSAIQTCWQNPTLRQRAACRRAGAGVANARGGPADTLLSLYEYASPLLFIWGFVRGLYGSAHIDKALSS